MLKCHPAILFLKDSQEDMGQGLHANVQPVALQVLLDC